MSHIYPKSMYPVLNELLSHTHICFREFQPGDYCKVCWYEYDPVYDDRVLKRVNYYKSITK